MARNKIGLHPEGLDFQDENGKVVTFMPLEGGGYKVVDVDSGKTVEKVGTTRDFRRIKRDVNGAVVFAGTNTNRGVATSLTGQTTNTNLSTTLSTTGNFCKAIANLKTTGTVTGGSAILKIMQGTNTLTSTSIATPTGSPTLTVTASNTVMTAPKALLSNAVTGGTVATMTLTEQLEDLVTNQTPLI